LDTGTIIAIIALVVSILGLFYTRQRIKIMEKQRERKRTFEETSRIIRQAIDIIKKNTNIENFTCFSLESARDILTYMHDNQIQTFKLYIKPKVLEGHYYYGSQLIKANVEKIETLNKIVCEPAFSMLFIFDCHPDILGYSHISLDAACYAIREFYRAYEILKSYDYVIDAFDNAVLGKLKQTIDDIVKTIFKSLMSEHEIIFSSTDKPKEVRRKMENDIVNRDLVRRLVWNLSIKICDQNLSVIQKETFLKS